MWNGWSKAEGWRECPTLSGGLSTSQQTLVATVENNSENASITLEGVLPVGGYVTAKQVSVSDSVLPDGESAVTAYDITVYTANGAEYEPDASVKVTIEDDAIKAAAGNGKALTVYHLSDGSSDASSVGTPSVTRNAICFEADSFSVYVVGNPVDPSINTVTYKFYDVDGTLLSTQAVKKGDTLYEPEVPGDKNGKTFTGWFEDGSTSAFTDFGTVGTVKTDGEVVSLHAQYANVSYVRYHDESGAIIET